MYTILLTLLSFLEKKSKKLGGFVEEVMGEVDDDGEGIYSVHDQTDSMVRTLYSSIVVGVVQLVIFECCRYMKPLYLKRVRKSFIAKNRVPPVPGCICTPNPNSR